MKPFSKISIQKQTRNKTTIKQLTKHYGFDTETLHGKLQLITYSGEHLEGHLYIDIENPKHDITDILKFLTQKKFRKSLNWFYNLDYDIRAILRHVPTNNIAELYQNKETQIKDYHLTFLSKKFFTITHQKQTYNFYDISQFFPGGLGKVSIKYLNNTKISTIDVIILGSSKEYWYKNLPEIIIYCIHDSFLTGELGKLFYSNLWNTLQFNPKKPYSTGSISQEYFINNSLFIPIIKNIPTNIIEIHQNNYRGGRIEIIQRGSFKNLYSYDIKSAYPSEMINLLDYSNGNWLPSTNFDDNYHGIYKIKFNWFHEQLGFIAFNSETRTVYPNAENCISYVNEKELCFLNDHPNFGEYEILEGHTFHPYNETYPYRDLILQLYDLKESAKNDNDKMIYKLFINSIYGKTAQAIYEKEIQKYKTGKLYNPIYSCRITANTRIKLLENSLKTPKSIVGFATDSIQTLTPNIKTGKKLGDFELEYKAKESVILMSGIRYTDKKQKMRGFTKKDENGKELILKEILQNNPQKTKIPIYINKPITIFQGLNYKKYTADDINIFKSEKRYLDINGDFRRIWKDDFKSVSDALRRNISSDPIFLECETNP